MDFTHILVAIGDHQQMFDDAISLEYLLDILAYQSEDIDEEFERKVGEELDYLLMSGIITGDDAAGYQLTDKWWDELSEEDRTDWLNCVGKSAIIDPVLITNNNPRNATRGRYAWEDGICSSFRFGLLPPDRISVKRIAIVSGRYHNPLLETVDAEKVRERIEPCLDGQWLYDLDLTVWPDVRDRLLEAGIYGLRIDYIDAM